MLSSDILYKVCSLRIATLAFVISQRTQGQDANTWGGLRSGRYHSA